MEQPRRRVRALNRLSAVRVTKAKGPRLYEDGGGLRLVVTDKGTKRWVLRVTIRGRRAERGLGVWPGVSLEDARRKAEVLRQAAREGRDAQGEERSEQKLASVTFRQAFEAFFAIRKLSLRNGKHVAQWSSTMETYVFPVFGHRPVGEVTPAEVLAVLQPIWFEKPETATRVLQRLRAVFDSAILRGTRLRANPCIGISTELGSDHRKVRHHPALQWREVPAFIQSIRQQPLLPSTMLAFEFLILTAARSGEVRGALWREIDLDNRVWTIPGIDEETGRRMKSERTHRVPLSSTAIAILHHARALREGELIFPGTKGQPLSDNTLSKLMRDMNLKGTPHGFRSTFKDWCAETGVRDEVSEAALAHVDFNQVRAAYRRTDFFTERVNLMERWAIATQPVMGKSDPADSDHTAGGS